MLYDMSPMQDDKNKLGEITPLPAYSDERIHLYLATGLTQAGQRLEADELITVHAIGWEHCLEMIVSGTIQDAKTVSGLHLAAGRMKSAGLGRPGS